MSFSADAETGFDGKVLRIQTICQVGKRISLATVGTGACIKKDMLVTALHCFLMQTKRCSATQVVICSKLLQEVKTGTLR